MWHVYLFFFRVRFSLIISSSTIFRRHSCLGNVLSSWLGVAWRGPRRERCFGTRLKTSSFDVCADQQLIFSILHLQIHISKACCLVPSFLSVYVSEPQKATLQTSAFTILLSFSIVCIINMEYFVSFPDYYGRMISCKLCVYSARGGDGRTRWCRLSGCAWKRDLDTAEARRRVPLSHHVRHLLRRHHMTIIVLYGVSAFALLLPIQCCDHWRRQRGVQGAHAPTVEI